MADVAERTGKRYRANFIEPGIISYDDVGKGRVFVGKPALDQMMNNFIGKPVVLDHIDPDTGREFEIGVVSDVGYSDGWYWADMMIFNEEVRRRIDQEGYSVSCAYVPTQTAMGGSYHGIDYETEVLDGVYTHMAIVENPRYEGSLIYTNSKKEMRMRLFSFKNKKGVVENESDEKDTKDEPEDEVMNAEDAYVEMENGDKVPISEMMAAYKESRNSGQMLNMDDEVDVDGDRVKVSELYDAYNTRNAAENAEAPQDVDAEEVVDETKQERGLSNAKPKSKKNENFSKLENAAKTGDTFVPEIETRSQRLARGSERYSRAVKNGGNS